MMILDIRKLNAQKKYSGDMEFEYSAPESLIEIPLVNFASKVKVSFSYDILEDDSVEIRGVLTYRIAGQCSKCLQSTEMEVEGELDAYFQPKKDAEDYSYSNGVIDLTRVVDDAIMSSMPFLLSCGDDCVGLVYRDETEK